MPYNLIINSDCNQNCSYCFAKDVIDSEKEISLDSIHLIKDFFLKSNKKNISLLGGEPTLHSSFTEIVEIFNQNDFNISIKTNALFNKEILDFFNEYSGKIHFLINVNEPSTYSRSVWNKLYQNISSLNNEFVILGFNISSPQFQYEHILELASKLNIRYIRWSFAHPIFYNTRNNSTQDFLPITLYKETKQKLLEFIKQAGALKITTLGDHSVPLCLFENHELDIIYKNNGEINSLCEGTIDITQNLDLLYCLPMKNLFHNLNLTDFSSLDEIELFFESRISDIRLKNLPFDDCLTCEYLKSNRCHGGCMSHRKFKKDEINTINLSWSNEYLKNRKLYIPDYIEFEEKENQIIVLNRANGYNLELNNKSYELLQIIQRDFETEQVLESENINNEFNDETIYNLIEIFRLYGILKLKNNGL